jgi:hypothetical protein
VPVADHKNVNTWFESIKALDAWKQTEPKFG